MSLILDEHRQYLADGNRVSAFRHAIEEVVTPGDVVLDLGSGTGILGLMACRAGAKRVYAVDEGPIVGLAREVAKANGFQDRITHIKGLSTRVALPETVDIVLADQIGRFGLESGILEYFADARVRFLKPGGVMVPDEVRLIVAPVENQTLFDQVEFWRRAPAGFDFGAACPIRFGALARRSRAGDLAPALDGDAGRFERRGRPRGGAARYPSRDRRLVRGAALTRRHTHQLAARGAADLPDAGLLPDRSPRFPGRARPDRGEAADPSRRRHRELDR